MSPSRTTGPLLLLFLLGQLIPSQAIWPLPPKRFSTNALIGAGSLGLDKLQGRIAALGDFDGNQFLDLVSLSDDQLTLTVHLWNHEAFEYRSASQLSLQRKIINVVPGDFNRDGRLDLLLMTESPSSRNLLDMFLYLGVSGGFDNNAYTLPSSMSAQPVLLDASGQMKIDLLGLMPDLYGGSGLTLWNNTRTGKDSEGDFFHLADAPFDGHACDISNPHSNAVIDFDGDCLADVFLMCGSGNQKSFQIWTNHKEQGFKLARSGSFPPNVGPVSFADMNRDGTIDMVFPTCSSISSSSGIGTNCKINIVYNKQKPLCSSSNPSTGLGKNCRLPDELCSADPDFDFNFETGSDTGMTSIDLASLFNDGSNSLLLYDTTATPPIPLPLRIGDVDLDGFPDLIPIIVRNDKGSSHTPQILISRPCSGKDVNQGRCPAKYGRTFSAMVNDVDPLATISDARGVALLDLDEDGTLDFMVQRTGSQTGSRVTFVQNNFFHDAFFMKAIVLSGACDGWCIPNNSSEPKYQPFGVSYSGPSYKYTILDTSGRRSAAQVGQLPQTSYHALHTPYAFFGLGRTNNYVENLFVGSTKHQPMHYINMEGVIPNSKVVIIPPHETNGGPGDWRKKLYLRPGDWIPWVTLTVVLTMIVLAVIVLVLHLNEKREDEMERRRRLHHINFDAL